MLYYIEWYKHMGKLGLARGRFAVYFRTGRAAYNAMQGWLLDNKVDGWDVKELES